MKARNVLPLTSIVKCIKFILSHFSKHMISFHYFLNGKNADVMLSGCVKKENKDKQYKESLLYYHKSKNHTSKQYQKASSSFQLSDKFGDTQSFIGTAGFHTDATSILRWEHYCFKFVFPRTARGFYFTSSALQLLFIISGLLAELTTWHFQLLQTSDWLQFTVQLLHVDSESLGLSRRLWLCSDECVWSHLMTLNKPT